MSEDRHHLEMEYFQARLRFGDYEDLAEIYDSIDDMTDREMESETFRYALAG